MRGWKLPSVFFALALICVMIPILAVRAGAEAYDIWVGGTQIDDTNLTTDDWEYEPSTGTLTLKGCTLTGELHASGAALVSQGIDLTVKGSGSLTGDGYGIRVFATPAGGGNLTLDVGELTAEGKGLAPESTDDSGIFADGSITILGGRLKAVGDDCGIYSKAGSITIKGGDVTAEAGEEIGDTAVRTDAGDITISGGKVKAEAGAGGIYAVGNVRIENGTKLVQAKAGTTAIRARDEAAAITIGDALEIKKPAGGKIGKESGFDNIMKGGKIARDVLIVPKETGLVLPPYEIYEWNLDGPGWKPVTAVFQSTSDPSELVVVKATVTSVLIPPNTIQYTAKATDPSGIVHTTTWTETVRDELSLDPHVPSRIPVPVVPVKPAGDLRPTAEPVIRIPGREPAEPTAPAVTDEVPAAADETPAIADEAPALPFADVADTDPWFGGIAYVWKSGIMNGVSESEFAPASTLTRAMLVTILGRLDGIDPGQYAGSSFTDCGAVGTWDYAPYVEWAARNGIVLGYGDGTFGPMDPVTNEQAVLMLQRYAKYLGTEEDGELTFGIFPEGTVSPWAAEAVSWAFGNSVYARTDSNPNEAACRGWMAQVIYNFVGYLIK